MMWTGVVVVAFFLLIVWRSFYVELASPPPAAVADPVDPGPLLSEARIDEMIELDIMPQIWRAEYCKPAWLRIPTDLSPRQLTQLADAFNRRQVKGRTAEPDLGTQDGRQCLWIRRRL